MRYRTPVFVDKYRTANRTVRARYHFCCLLGLVLLLVPFASNALLARAQEVPPHRTLLLISIDGLRPEYIFQADRYHLHVPNLQRLVEDGSHASSVTGVLPTVTYPSHTTIMTGVWPVKHGIVSNTTFDPYAVNYGGWYWYSQDIRVPTLWEAAAKAGYSVGSVSWPVSVGAPGVRYLIPEYWRAMTPDDLKLLKAISTPHLFDGLQKSEGFYTTSLYDPVPADWGRTRFAAAIIREKHVNFMTVHLAALDSFQHAHGPFSPEANAGLEEIDKMVGMLEQTIRDEDKDAVICVVSDHGFARVEHVLNLDQAFVKAGLITLKAQKDTLGASGVADWKAEPWDDDGSAAIVLKNPRDEATIKQVKQLLVEIASDPNNGVASILGPKQVAALGGAPSAAFWLDLKPGYEIGNSLQGPMEYPVKLRGTHGYSPVHSEMHAFFLITGPGIQKRKDIGNIDMRSIAPTLAKVMDISFPSADLGPLPIFTNVGH